VDRTHGPVGRPKQTKLSERVCAHLFRSQIWARNASARTARASTPPPPCPPRAQPTEAPSHSPLLPCVSLLRTLLLLSVDDTATPIAGVRLPPPTTKKKPLLPPHPDAALGRRRPPLMATTGRVERATLPGCTQPVRPFANMSMLRVARTYLRPLLAKIYGFGILFLA
jgi:hypothetical protein